LRGASLIAGLALALVAPQLPSLVPLSTARGRLLAGAALVVLAAGAALGVRAVARAREQLPRAGAPAWLLVGALLWVWILIPPWQDAASPARAAYGALAGILAPLAGLGWTLAAARHARRTGVCEAPGARGGASIAAAAAVASAIALVLGFLVLEHAPHVPDEIAYLFDARTLAAGHRFAAPPPVREAFPPPDWIQIDASRAYGVFPIGWPLILAAGVKVGAPWLVNAVLVAGIVLAIAWLARVSREIQNGPDGADSPAAAAWLAALSPFLLFLGASYTAHPAAVLAAAVVLASYLALERKPAPSRVTSLLALGAGSLVLVRPVEAAALALALAWDAIAERRRGTPLRTLPLLALIVGFGVGGVALLADQARVTGDPLLPPVTRYFDERFGPGRNRLGFGADIGLDWDGTAPGHSPGEAITNLWRNLHALDRHLFGWPAGSLLLALIGLLSGGFRRADRLLVRHGLLILGLYALYWYHGIAYGPRFLSALVPGLVLFTLRGAGRVLAWIAPLASLADPARAVRAAIGISMAAALAFYLPLAAWVEFRHLRGVDGALRRQVEATPPPALFFVHGPVWPDFASLYDLNAPDFHGPRVVALARGAESDSALARLYPEHSARLIERPR